MTSPTVLSKALGTFLRTYGGREYRDTSIEDMKVVFDGLMDILVLDGPTKVIMNKLKRKVAKMNNKEKLLFAVSEKMLELEGMGG